MTIEAFVPKDIPQTLDYEEKYRGVSGGSITALAAISVTLLVGVCAARSASYSRSE